MKSQEKQPASEIEGQSDEDRRVGADYKDLDKLRQHITETGKIIPTRISGTTAGYQRQLARAIRRARFLALLPYTNQHR